MPTRVLREGILTSPRVNKLNANEELFYRRLMSVVDDYGRYYAHETLLRAACYPFQLDRVKEDSISKHLAACVDARLIFPYTVNGTAYLQLLDFRQQTRSDSKFPEPDKQLYSECLAIAKQLETGCKSNALVVGVGVVGEDVKSNVGPEARRILAFLNEKAQRRYQANRVNLGFIENRLKDGATPVECRQVIVKKCREWGTDEKMDKYLRPATLFNATKFSQYQGELVAPAEAPRETS